MDDSRSKLIANSLGTRPVIVAAASSPCTSHKSVAGIGGSYLRKGRLGASIPGSCLPPPPAVTIVAPSNMAQACRAPIFENGILKSGVYKIQNIYTETYLDIHLHSMEVCCRPANDLGVGRGLWRIGRLGDGYAVWRVDPGNPSQFCSPTKGLNIKTPIYVSAYPSAWRIQPADDDIYRGFEYVRFHWGTTNTTWDLWSGCKDNGTLVKCYPLAAARDAWQVWKLIPVEAEDAAAPPQPWPELFDLGPLPQHDLVQPPAPVQRMGLERDEFGTVVTEVTIVTTHKRYRVEDA